MALGQEQRQHLHDEAGHFFQAELANEQRASWILALDSVLLLALFGTLRDLPQDGGPSVGVTALTVSIRRTSASPLCGRDRTSHPAFLSQIQLPCLPLRNHS